MGANDTVCGQLGDPFFVATLPDNPEGVFSSSSVCPEGVYEVQVNGETVIVDDFIPCIEGQPAFTQSAGGLMWPLIYEKAVAKLTGCYDALSNIRRGGQAPNTPQIDLPARVCTSARREYAIREFLGTCASAAALSGHDHVLEEFSEFFADTPRPADCLDGVARAMDSMGNHEKYSIPLRAPALSVKINSDTLIHVEATRPKAQGSEGKMVLCICEVGDHSWRLLRGKVATEGQDSASLDLKLKATGKKFIVFTGTPVTSAMVADITLDITTDTQVDITHA